MNPMLVFMITLKNSFNIFLEHCKFIVPLWDNINKEPIYIINLVIRVWVRRNN